MGDSLEEILSRDGFVIHSVQGTSMKPMLNQFTDLVRIVPAMQPLKCGDIPLYRAPNGKYVLHRVIAVRKSDYLICGDNRSFAEAVPFSWIVGVAEGFYKNGEYVPCTDPRYLDYVKSVVRRRRPRAFLLRFKLFRGIRKAKHRFRKKHE